MPAYIICTITVTDPSQYQKYVELAGPVVRRNGGDFLVRGEVPEVLEGHWDGQRIVVARFESAQAARRSYHSPEYQAARSHRLLASSFNAVLVDSPG